MNLSTRAFAAGLLLAISNTALTGALAAQEQSAPVAESEASEPVW